MTATVQNPLLLSAFVSFTSEHVLHGVWRKPGSRELEFNSVDYWVEIARLLERGKFDFMFFADVVGMHGPYAGDYRMTAERAIHFPVNDPASLAAVLAYTTDNLGIAFTSSILQEHPFTFARKMSTLDHLTQGRVAWNVVTGALGNAARNYGFSELVPHDERYVWAEEYMDVVYKLWEGSWDEGSFPQDRVRGVHANWDKIHMVNHVGQRYRVEGPHLSAPSPQRTPFLFQAGASSAGRQFAARHAEAVFFAAVSIDGAVVQLEDTRKRAARLGRDPDDLKFFLGLHFVVGDTEEEARRKSVELDEHLDDEAQLSNLSGALGVDFGVYGPDAPVGAIKSDGVRGIATMITQSVKGREPVIRDIAKVITRDGRIIGTPEQIADQLQAMHDRGIDGINVFNTARPENYVEFVDHVVPVLQKRGLVKSEYVPGPIRNKIFGWDRLPDRHPGATYRGAFSD